MSGNRDEKQGDGDEPSFKVIDRRRFAADGSERDEEVVADPAEVPPAAQPEATQPPMASSASPEHEPGVEASDAAPGVPLGEPYEPQLEAASFDALVLSLSTQVLVCLGEIPEAPGQEPRRDLEAAKNVIDLLAILQEKTTGNLSKGEGFLLERVLYDLRMRYVEIKGS